MKKIFISCLVSLLFIFSLNAQTTPIVQDIQAAASKGTRINIYWTLPLDEENSITQLLLYRDTKPITNSNQLQNALLLAQLPPETCGYTDFVQDYNDYYYAVIVCTDKAYDYIFISMNSTVTGVHLEAPKNKIIEQKEKNQEKLYENGTMRETPLPYINFVEGQNQEELISKETASNAAKLSMYNSKSNDYDISLYFFEEDLISPDGGDDFLLFEVLKTTLVQEKYEEAIVALEKLNGTNISQNVRDRVCFYIGEAYFFSGDFEEAVKNFVKVTQAYPLQTKIWINYSLDKLSIPNK